MLKRGATALILGMTALMARADAEPIVILIGGNQSDPSPAQLAGTAGRGGNSGLWRMKEDLLRHDRLEAEYFNWNGTRAGKIKQPSPPGAAGIVDLIRHRRSQNPAGPIVIVGNSWGGHSAWEVCRLLDGAEGVTPVNATPNDSKKRSIRAVRVDLVVFLDPSSLGRTKEPNPSVLPRNVRKAVNYFTRNSFSWSAWPKEPRISNVDLGDPANGFLDTRGPKYNSIFNWRAHVSAEWDETIHADIRRQIRTVCHSQDKSAD